MFPLLYIQWTPFFLSSHFSSLRIGAFMSQNEISNITPAFITKRNLWIYRTVSPAPSLASPAHVCLSHSSRLAGPGSLAQHWWGIFHRLSRKEGHRPTFVCAHGLPLCRSTKTHILTVASITHILTSTLTTISLTLSHVQVSKCQDILHQWCAKYCQKYI